MPLAHPVSASPTSNFGQPAIAISFALAKPGETVDDFQLTDRQPWRMVRRGMAGQGGLVLTAESVERLVRLLESNL